MAKYSPFAAWKIKNMRRKLLIIFIVLILKPCVAQETIRHHGSNLKFNSIFQELKIGKFTGTINGVLFLQKPDSNQIILDFQGSSAELNISEDEDAIYDVSTKNYTGQTTSGKSKLVYSTYATSHNFEIKFPNSTYLFGTIDGCACVIINGLNFHYQSEKDHEYLVLSFANEIKLRKKDERMDSENFLKVMPNSSIVFAIKKK